MRAVRTFVSKARAKMTSLAKNIEVTHLTPNIYKANLSQEFCVGEVPNGGYVASVMMAAASDYLGPRGQPDTLQAHFQFLGRTSAGPAYVVVKDVKLGRNTSIVHVSLHQADMLPSAPWIDASASTNGEIFAYLTNIDLSKERGISLPTQWELAPPQPAPRPANLASLPNDPAWKKYHIPLMDRVKTLQEMEYYVPTRGFASRATQDYWVRLVSQEPFTNLSLGMIADSAAPFIIEAYRQTREEAKETPRPDQVPFGQVFWYPTLTMSIDVKKKLPPGGVEWLRMRASSKQIRNGRSDSEIVIFDETGDLVALSNHVALAVDFRMNSRGRNRPSEKM